MIRATVIADSISPQGDRLTTVEVTMHRFVLAELNTHRVFSRNSASSRAIPVERQLERVKERWARPVRWPAEQPGMQGGGNLQGENLKDAQQLFEDAHDAVIALIERYLAAHPEKSSRLHKSVVNRLLEPFLWHTVIVSATEWENFFGLRCSELAQPEFQQAANAIRDAISDSVPTALEYGQWHTPYLRAQEKAELLEAGRLDEALQISAARCARVSYLTHDGVRDLDKDLELYRRLVASNPPHASPLEHVATPARPGEKVLGNFQGWHQFRHLVQMK